MKSKLIIIFLFLSFFVRAQPFTFLDPTILQTLTQSINNNLTFISISPSNVIAPEQGITTTVIGTGFVVFSNSILNTSSMWLIADDGVGDVYSSYAAGSPPYDTNTTFNVIWTANNSFYPTGTYQIYYTTNAGSTRATTGLYIFSSEEGPIIPNMTNNTYPYGTVSGTSVTPYNFFNATNGSISLNNPATNTTEYAAIGSHTINQMSCYAAGGIGNLCVVEFDTSPDNIIWTPQMVVTGVNGFTTNIFNTVTAQYFRWIINGDITCGSCGFTIKQGQVYGSQ